MAAGSNSNQNLRKAIGAIKDSTMVGMAKVNSEYKDLDVAILKATNHVESLPKEKHVRTILGAVSGSRARVDVMYCIQALARRLAKTKTWIVALKTLIVIHRALREVDHSFCEELISYNNRRGHMLNLLHFKDESSPSAWDYSTWIRTYALYIEECLECFRVLKFDFYRDHSRTKKFDTPDLLDQLPAMQQLLFRLLACQPYGSARYNFIIQYALSIVATESVRLYVSITDGVLNLVDKYFEMQKRDAVRALEIYRRSGEQAEKLSDFFEVCRTLEFGRRQKYVKIEQAPSSFLAAMEEYVKDAPQTLMLPWRPDDSNVPKEIDDTEESDPKQNSDNEDSNGKKTDAEPAPLIPDLLSWDEPSQEPSLPDPNNPVSLLLAAPEDSALSTEASSEPAGWELALVTTTDAATQNKVDLFDRSTLDRLYELALVPKPEPTTANHIPAVSSNPFEDDSYNQEAYYPPNFMQMGEIPQQYQAQYQQQGLLVGPDYMGEIPQQQTQYQQQGLVVGPDYMQLVATQHIAAQQYPQLEPPNIEVDYNQIAGIPQQQGSPLPPHQQQEQLAANQQFVAQQNPLAAPETIDVDYKQIAGIPQQQGSAIPPHQQQQEQPVMRPEDMQIVVPTQIEQQQTDLMIGHANTQEVEIPKQQELLVGQEHDSPFGNPFVIEGSLPNPPQAQTSNSSVTPDLLDLM